MTETLASIGVLLVRPGMLVMTAPFFGAVFAPPQVRAGLTLMFAIVLGGLVTVPPLTGPVGVAAVVAREVMIGASLGLAIRLLTAAAEFAGSLGSFQSGMSMGAMIDPASGVRNTQFAAVYTNLVVVVGFITNAHHTFFKALVATYQAAPIGAGAVVPGTDPALAMLVARMLGFVFLYGMRLAAPMLVVLFLVEVALGMMTKVAPSLNLMVVGMPARLPVALLLLALTTSVVPGLVSQMVPAAVSIVLDAARALR